MDAQLSHAIAVKAMIENHDGNFLLIKRSDYSQHATNEWDIPGGRIDPGEDPFVALVRECQEEVGMDVVIEKPIGVSHFTRDDGQMIVMIIFYCRSVGHEAVLSEEHSDYQWVDKVQVKEQLVHMGYAVVNT